MVATLTVHHPAPHLAPRVLCCWAQQDLRTCTTTVGPCYAPSGKSSTTDHHCCPGVVIQISSSKYSLHSPLMWIFILTALSSRDHIFQINQTQTLWKLKQNVLVVFCTCFLPLQVQCQTRTLTHSFISLLCPGRITSLVNILHAQKQIKFQNYSSSWKESRCWHESLHWSQQCRTYTVTVTQFWLKWDKYSTE